MIVHEPEIEITHGEITLKTRIETNKRFDFIPDYLYFRFPEEYESMLLVNNNASAICALPLAMFFNENLEIRGQTSPKLAFGLLECVPLFVSEFPRIFKPMDIKFERFRDSRIPQTERFGAIAFSGGIDSIFTVWDLLHQNQVVPFTTLKYGLFMQGLDTRLDDKEGFEHLAKKFKVFFDDLGLELLTGWTNFFLFSQFRLDWIIAHGFPLIASAHLFGNALDKFFVSSTAPYTNLGGVGTSPISDHWLSSEGTEIIHYGSRRGGSFEKLLDIKDWEPVHKLLRVCSNKNISPYRNCGKCNKCLRTMVFLELLGVYPRFKTFDKPFSLWHVLIWGWKDHLSTYRKKLVYKEALKRSKYFLAFLSQIALVLGLIRKTEQAIILRLIPKEALLQIKRRIFVPEIDQEPN